MSKDHTKAPRLFISQNIDATNDIILSPEQSHYLMNVMRKKQDDIIRVFNGKDAEYIGKINIASKKITHLTSLQLLKPQPEISRKIHLFFAPIKKDRIAYLIEKSVELGVTDLHPILTERTENRNLNTEKIQSYIIEAAEQCERMDVPTFHNLTHLQKTNFISPTYAGIERAENLSLFSSQDNNIDLGLLIGPEGGWSENEKNFLITHPSIKPTNLGQNILRAETAAVFMLSRIASLQ